MPSSHKVLFITQRGLRHQQDAIDWAPPSLEIIMRRDPPLDEIMSLLPGVSFLISERAGVINEDMFAAAPQLKLVQRLGRQTWDIDLAAARRYGVPVCCQPIPGCRLVAEHMVMHALALIKKLRETLQIAEAAGTAWGQPKKSTEDTFAYNWSDREGIGGLFDKTVGVLGFGEIGVEIALILQAFGCQVIYHKRNRLPDEAEESLHVSYADINTIQAQSDVIFNLLPDFPDTRHFLNAAFYDNCERGVFLVHAGGGTTVDPDATAQALLSGQLGGASLDTFNWEPIRQDDPLVDIAHNKAINILLTPHIAAGALKGDAFQRSHDYENLLATLEGKPLKHQVA